MIGDSTMKLLRCATFVVFCTIAFADGIAADKRPSADDVVAKFAKSWDDSTWRPKSRRGGYMRPLKDVGWKARMTALQQLVQQGKTAVPVLVKTLKSGKIPERILAAQALGYLSPHAPIDALLDAAKNDRSATVRLYAVDSLGMQGPAAKGIDWKSLSRKERNRDARMHIRYARERKGAAVKKEIVATLRKWKPETMDSAVVGKKSPSFSLKSAQGKRISLADFHGKKAVVLVFVYGDT